MGAFLFTLYRKDRMAVLFDQVVATGATGGWFYLPARGLTHVPVSIQLASGTATITIEGRISEGDAPVSLVQVSASEGAMVAAFPQMRVVVSGAASGDVRVTLGAVAKAVV